MKKVFIGILGIFLTVSGMFAQGEAALPSFMINKSAVPSGLAGAYTAIAEGGAAIFYNPAGLVQNDYITGNLGYTNWAPDNDAGLYALHAGAGYNMPGVGNLGLGLHYFNYGNFYSDMPDSYDMFLSLGYGYKLSCDISVGAAVKYIRSEQSGIDEFNKVQTYDANGLAFDFGALFRNIFPDITTKNIPGIETKDFLKRNKSASNGLSVGLAIMNIGKKIYYVDEAQSDPLPQYLRLGLAWNALDNDLFGVTISTDIQKLLVHADQDGVDSAIEAIFSSWQDFRWNELEVSLGMEIEITKYFAFRAGRFFEDPSYGGRKYYTYGFSFGPEFARFNLAIYDDKNRTAANDGTVVFEGAFAL